MSVAKREGFWRSLWEVLKVAAMPGMATHQFLIDSHNALIDEFYRKPARIAASTRSLMRPSRRA